MMEIMIIELVQKYPIIASILIAIGALRAVFKPLMSAVQAYVDYTVDTGDNEKLKKIIESRGYKALSYILDYSASIKLPQAPTPDAEKK